MSLSSGVEHEERKTIKNNDNRKATGENNEQVTRRYVLRVEPKSQVAWKGKIRISSKKYMAK